MRAKQRVWAAKKSKGNPEPCVQMTLIESVGKIDVLDMLRITSLTSLNVHRIIEVFGEVHLDANSLMRMSRIKFLMFYANNRP